MPAGDDRALSFYLPARGHCGGTRKRVPSAREGGRMGAIDARIARRRRAGARGARPLGAYLALTKPGIISLLLITTVPTMILAEKGMPVAVADLRDGARRHAGRRRRQRDQLLHRPRHRPDDAPHAGPAAADRARSTRRARSIFALVLEVVGVRAAGRRGEPARGGAGAVRDGVLRLRLHDVAQADDAAEHRHRRRGRRSAAARRLGRRDGRRRLAGARAVRHHLLLDAAALLGARRSSTRTTTRAPTCRCCPSWRRCRRRSADLRVRAAARAGEPQLVLYGHGGVDLRRGRRSCSARSSCASAWRLLER